VPTILTTWVFPIAFVIAAGAVLVEVVRGAGRSAMPSRLACVPLVFYAGDALVGDHRPPMERLWKGVVVALLAVAYLWAWWRTRRARPSRFDRSVAHSTGTPVHDRLLGGLLGGPLGGVADRESATGGV
jgi:hypothetical protein